MTIKTIPIVIAILVIGFSTQCHAVAQLFEGREEINGITLLQDDKDQDLYYYVPPFPRVAKLESGQSAFSFMRYTGGSGGGGAALSVMVEFSLPPEFQDQLELDLKARHENARIAGPVVFTDPADDLQSGEKATAGFKLVSATIGSPGTRSVTSGSAPIGGNGRAAIAARLGSEDAALLWSAFQVGAMTDIAFEVDAAYLARIESFNAVVEAEMSTVYQHFSEIDNEQQGIKRDQMRNIVDSMIRDQAMTIRSSDSGEAFNISSAKQEKLLEMVVDKLISVMFDVESGWSKPVNYENPVEEGQLPGRIEGGTISGSMLGVAMFGGDIGYKQHTDYVPDDQYVLRKRQDIRVNKFRMDLTRSQLIRVPYRTTGNLGSAYASLGDDPRYFNYIDIDDQTRDKIDVEFSLDSNYVGAFGTVFDSVVVELQHGEGEEKAQYSARLAAADISNARLKFEPLSLRRLGSSKADWNQYQYRVFWNLKGRSTPISEGWVTAQEPHPTIRPPLQRSEVKVLFDGGVFADESVRAVVVDIMSSLNSRKQILNTVRSLSTKPSLEYDLVVFHDPESRLVSRTSFITPSNTRRATPSYVENNLVYVFAPNDIGVEAGGKDE